MKIAIDFDGTCVTHDFPKVGKEIGAATVLRELVNQGHQLILWTMRSDCSENTGFSDCIPEVHNGNFLSEAKEWFTKHEIPLFGCQRNPEQDTWTSSPKCYAQLYIDDAALGCPLIMDENISERPFADWATIAGYLMDQNILNQDEVFLDRVINEVHSIQEEAFN